MGGNQSSQQKVQSVQKTEDLQDGQFGISVSGQMIEKGLAYDMNLEQKLQDAYQKGKSDGIQTIQHTLSEVAAQTYDQINNQLSDMQSKHVAESKAMAESLSKRVLLPEKSIKACRNEDAALTACLNSNVSKPLACAEFVDEFTSCSSNAIKTLSKRSQFFTQV